MGKFLSRPGAAKQLQQALANARHIGGSPYYAGPVDGILGPASQAAIVAFRKDHDLSPTVEIDNTMLRLLGLGPALITEPGTLGNIIALPIIEFVLKTILNRITKGQFPMLTTIDKAWVAGVVAFVCNYIVNHFFHITIDDGTQGLIVNLLVTFVVPMVAVWAVPNKPKPA